MLVGVASVYEHSRSVRLRKFAVDENYQGKGIGSALLVHAINQAKVNKASMFWCDAREDAIEFYKRFGLKVNGSKFYKSGIPYFKMGVNLELI